MKDPTMTEIRQRADIESKADPDLWDEESVMEAYTDARDDRAFLLRESGKSK